MLCCKRILQCILRCLLGIEVAAFPSAAQGTRYHCDVNETLNIILA